MTDTGTSIDQVTLTIIDNHLGNICEEMAIAMKRTALSPIFNEALDFVCVLFNRRGELIAQAEMNPALIAPGLFSTAWAIEEFGLESFEPGDVLVTNDPYRGCAHMPEHTMLKPIFHQGELFGFAANVAHVAEIGGMAVGSFAANATDVFQEGLRLPLTKLMSRGEYVKDIWRVIMANHRTPTNTWGDFHAMLGSLTIGERRVTALLDKYGAEFITRATDELIAYAERWMRSEIARIPDGEYRFSDQMDDDGFTRQPVPIQATVIVQGDEILVDYTGSSPQARGPINATYVVTAASVYNAVFQLTSPDVPRNSGTYRPIAIIAPPGTVVNVQYPGPCVGGQTETHPRLLDLVQGGALSQALPEQVAAAGGGTSCNFLFGGVHPETGQYYAHYHFEGIGWGGRYATDGNNVQCVPHGNCQNTPIEIMETRFPLRHIHYGLRPDSGGPGRTRGGLGEHRIFEITAPEMRVSALFDRTESRPWGLFGGLPGEGAQILVKPRGEDRFKTFSEAFGTLSPSKFTNVILHAGDQVLIDSPGGGGNRPPEQREPERVREDVEEGFISPAAARDFYKVALVQHDGRWRVDAAATATLRGREI